MSDVKRGKPKKLVVQIRGDDWEIYKVHSDDFAEGVKDSDLATAGAFCSPTEHQIVIDEKHFNKHYIGHELWHAFSSYLFLASTTKLTVDDIEEINAEMFSASLDTMYKVRNHIYRELK